MGLILRNRQSKLEALRLKTWIDELRERFPNCPNPVNYPKSAADYLEVRLYALERKAK